MPSGLGMGPRPAGNTNPSTPSKLGAGGEKNTVSFAKDTNGNGANKDASTMNSTPKPLAISRSTSNLRSSLHTSPPTTPSSTNKPRLTASQILSQSTSQHHKSALPSSPLVNSTRSSLGSSTSIRKDGQAQEESLGGIDPLVWRTYMIKSGRGVDGSPGKGVGSG